MEESRTGCGTGRLASAHLAVRRLRGGGRPPVLQQLLLQFVLLLRGVEAVHRHELVAKLLQPGVGAEAAGGQGRPFPSHRPLRHLGTDQVSHSTQPQLGP